MTLVLGLASLALFVGQQPSELAQAAGHGAKRDTRPNILIVVTDDQRLDTMDAMPRTSAWIARNAIYFKNAFATTPRCCPSRSSIMTGRYAHNHGVRQNGESFNLDHATTLQSYLHDAGYTTAMLGKLLNFWDVEKAPPHFDRWALLDPRAPKSDGYNHPFFNIDGRVRYVRQYSTDFISLKAQSFLEDFESRDSKPWYMYVAPYGPHSPYTPADRHEGAPVTPWASNPAVEETDLSDKPLWVQNMAPVTQHMAATAEQQRRTLLSIDEMVADLLAKMRRLDERRDTLVFFLSDNGYMWGEHRVRGKKSPYEQSVRVPFAVSWPARITPNPADERIVANIDIAPTVFEAAGMVPPVDPPMDGRSLLGAEPRTELLLEFWQARGVPGWAAVSGPDYQYTEWHDGQGNPYFFEYYDMTTDPWQLDNLLADEDEANDPDTSALSTRLEAYRSCSGSNCP